MIYGIGVDMATVGRLEKSLKNPAFPLRFFGEQERAELSRRAHPAESAAARFAAKEAFGKAAGFGLTGFVWTDVQVLHGPNGEPRLEFYRDAAAWMRERRLRAHLSLTHEGGFATAFVVLEGADEPLMPGAR